jgi:hypothetical protein
MADEPTPLPPLEIPWKLASTTQPLATGEPAQTALSLFFFEPDDAALIGAFPDQRIVFVKLTASVSPASIPPTLSPVAAAFLGEGVPCMHLLLDLKVSAPDHVPGTVRPYFHAAAPLNRRMVQTGVVGGDAYEGESESLAIGKSGTQMRESLRSHASTTTASASAGVGVGIGPVSIGVSGGVSNTTTDLSSNRAVSQVVDTTQRQAAEERRELISHTTNVENIISLLRAKYVGTPHLSFSLSPQPLTQLSVDPSDPNLWFQQLLARRSSGIEGIQEFTAVIVVPRGTGFCLNARLRRVCLLDSPPGPFEVRERFDPNLNLLQLNRMVQYLNRTFPAGTPLDELDIDILAGLANSGLFRRPVVELWGLRLAQQLVVASVVSPSGTNDALATGRASYKHFLEVWVDTLRDEYEREVARSPLERGMLFGENRFLDTCFGFAGGGDGGDGSEGPFVVTSSTANVGPLVRVPLPRGVFDIGGSAVLAQGGNRSSTRSHALETTTRWNAIDQRVAGLLSNGLIAAGAAEVPLKANDPALVSVLLEHWRKLPADDPRNLGFEQAAALLKLGDAQRKALGGTGARNLSAMATALVGAARVEEHNADVARAKELFKKRRLTGAPDPLPSSLSARQAAAIVGGIGDVLVSGSAKPLVDAVLGAPSAGGVDLPATGVGGSGGIRQGARKSSSRSSNKSAGKGGSKGKG